MKESYDQQLQSMFNQYTQKLTEYEKIFSKESLEHIAVKEKYDKIEILR